MKTSVPKKMVLSPVEKIRMLAARSKAAEDHAETTRSIARLARQKLKSARRTYKHARKVAKRARKEAAKLGKSLAAMTKKARRGKIKSGETKKSPPAAKSPSLTKINPRRPLKG